MTPAFPSQQIAAHNLLTAITTYDGPIPHFSPALLSACPATEQYLTTLSNAAARSIDPSTARPPFPSYEHALHFLGEICEALTYALTLTATHGPLTNVPLISQLAAPYYNTRKLSSLSAHWTRVARFHHLSAQFNVVDQDTIYAIISAVLKLEIQDIVLEAATIPLIHSPLIIDEPSFHQRIGRMANTLGI